MRAPIVRSSLLIVFLAIAAPLPAQSAAQTSLRLPRILSSGMVVQRGVPMPIWGWAHPGVRVDVSANGNAIHTTAAADSSWRVTLPAPRTGPPFTVTIASGETTVTLRDVLAGDVWIASGQSNMALNVAAAANPAAEIAAARDSTIREFAVPRSYSFTPLADVVGGDWHPGDSSHVGRFSAVAYFFARGIRQRAGAPIGIIHTSWGGSPIQTWMSRAALQLTDSDMRRYEEAERILLDSLRAALGVTVLPKTDSGLVDGRGVWSEDDLDESSWRTIKAPGYWENQGFPGVDGVIWYRTRIDLTAAEAAAGIRLQLGRIDDDDITWVNGTEVGRTRGHLVLRVYEVPASLLRAGSNSIVVRVADRGGAGGFNATREEFVVVSGAARKPLPTEWRFKAGEVSVSSDGRINKVPNVLYNAMVKPLADLPIKGVIWYQGESNAGNEELARQYRDQFARLIKSWRSELGGGRSRFPFVWVQLPNYGRTDSLPPLNAGWALLRESQAAALAEPQTAQAVTIDIGDAADLHPRNKQDVAKRLALAARAVAYGEKIPYRGPMYSGHNVRGNRVTVRFTDAQERLISRAVKDGANMGDRVDGFAIAGEDGVFHWAQARISGKTTVVVWSEAVANPIAVRYGWANSPVNPSLYNSIGLPAIPFRTDSQ